MSGMLSKLLAWWRRKRDNVELTIPGDEPDGTGPWHWGNRP